MRSRTRAARAAIVLAALPALLALLLSSCAAPSGAAPSDAAPDDQAPHWRALFNGRDLDGWVVKIAGQEPGSDPRRTFRVEDGVLKVRYDGYGEFDGQFGHLFSAESFSHYRLRVEYRFTGEQCAGGPLWAWRNSGVMLHAQAPESMRREQEFPVSLECQLLGGDGHGARPTANLCTPGTIVVMDGAPVASHCTDSLAPTFSGDQWVTVEVEVHGDRTIRHIVDGQTVLLCERPQLDPDDADARALIRGGDLRLSGGRIALQAESHPVEFRRVEILPLDE